MTIAKIGWGAEFWLASAVPTLTELGEIIGISLPNAQVADVDATHFKSASRRREYIAGLVDLGEAQIEMNYDPGSASDVIIRAALVDAVARAYKIIVPDVTTNWSITGTCIVKGYERNVPIDDRMTATLTIRFTGAETEAQV